LIGLTHHLANFLTLLYEMIKQEVLNSLIIQADETPHKMLEGDDTSNWYLWGFLSLHSCYFEARDTRSGDVAIDFLKEALAEYLVTDAYSGYSRAIKEIKKKYDKDIIEVHCNAHAYRYFKDAATTWEDETAPFRKIYGEIYELERQKNNSESNLTLDEKLKRRKEMIPLFENFKELCEQQKEKVMPKSSIGKAINYFLNHFSGLTVCTTNIYIPLDNNLSEREMRSPVIGRKTWYGTHSKRGAKTNAMLFSIVSTCKMNNINPRKYFPWVVERIYNGKEVLTPYEYSKLD
jgi:transposase